MIVRFLSRDEVFNGGFMPTSVARAQRLIVRRSYQTKRHLAFIVTDPVSGSEHVVIYRSEKKPPLDWSCDCEWYSTRTVINGKYCAHILAVQLRH